MASFTITSARTNVCGDTRETYLEGAFADANATSISRYDTRMNHVEFAEMTPSDDTTDIGFIIYRNANSTTEDSAMGGIHITGQENAGEYFIRVVGY